MTALNKLSDVYLDFKLAKIPCWLAHPEKRANKEASSMVLAIEEDDIVASLRISSFTLFNKQCRFSAYLNINDDIQCSKCLQFGHRTRYCTNDTKCSVCTQGHDSKDYKCDKCKGGPKFTHPTIYCINCPGNPGHKANDPNCST